MVRKTLTDSELEALDMILAYISETESEDYFQRIEEGDSVEDHVYELHLKLSKLWD